MQDKNKKTKTTSVRFLEVNGKEKIIKAANIKKHITFIVANLAWYMMLQKMYGAR